MNNYTFDKIQRDSKVRISNICLTISNLLNNSSKSDYGNITDNKVIEEIKVLISLLNSELKLLYVGMLVKEMKEYRDFLIDRHFSKTIFMKPYDSFYFTFLNKR